MTLTEQKKESRIVNHLLYASPVKRGEDIEVIEDIIPVYDIKVKVRIPFKVKRVYLAPQGKDIEFEQKGDFINYLVSKIECHQMVVIE